MSLVRKGKLAREVTTRECNWLDGDFPKGKVVYEYYGYTYGCISPTGVAVSDAPDEHPFYEIPRDAVVWES